MMLNQSSRIATLTIAVVLFAVLSSLASNCQAQRQRRFVLGQEAGRFLGLGHGAGYHCSNPGHNTDYYNPYSAHNSQLTASNEPYRGYGQSGYASFDSDTVTHSEYTGRGDQHSVFESLPGQTLQPKFEPAVDRTRKKKEEADNDGDFGLDDDSDFDPDEDFDDSSDFDPDAKSIFDTPSKIDDLGGFGADASGDDGGFDSLKENFESTQKDGPLPPDPDAFGDDKDSLFLN